MSNILRLGRGALGGAAALATQPSELGGEAARAYAAGSVIEQEGAPAPHAWAVLSGWVGCCRTLGDGRRQILKLALPGEVLLTWPTGGPTQFEAIALTRTRILDLGAAAAFLEPGSTRDPSLQRLVRAAEQADQARLIMHLLRLGRLSALERTAHFLLELHQRLHRRPPQRRDSMEMPLTQEALAEFLGLSIVHVNRTLQQLRRQGMIDYRAGRVVFLDPRRLSAACGYVASGPPAAA